MGSRQGGAASFVLLAFYLAAVVPSASALSWRIFAGWPECVSTYMPDAQWDILQQSLTAHSEPGQHQADVATFLVIEAGVLVANEYGSESYRGAVDIEIYDPVGKKVFEVAGVQDKEIEFDGGHGVKGPWKMCFKIAQHDTYKAPSVLLELSYFVVNHQSLIGSSYEHERSTKQALSPGASEEHPEAHLGHFDVDHMPTLDQVNEVMDGLVMLDAHLQGVEHEAHHLSMRTTRHLKTIKSTHFRTMVYYLGIYSAIVGASFLQVAGVRYMFSGSVGSLPVSLGRMNMHTGL